MTENALPMGRIAAAVRRKREQLGLTLSELARRAQVGKSTLSQLESGLGNPSLETMWALATALEVPIAQLLAPPAPTVTVLRAGEGTTLVSSDPGYAATLLSMSPPGVRRDVYRVTVERGRFKESEPHPLGTVEHLLVTSGRASAGLQEDPVELDAGDFITYPGDRPHVFGALADGTSAVLISESG